MSTTLLIHGGVPLYGEVAIAGAKNAALPMLCAALLTKEEVILDNVPHLNDVNTLINLLRELGVKVEREGNRVRLCAANLSSTTASYELVKTMRASVLVLGPLLAHWGQAQVSMPGGCAIGSRPVDQHIKGLIAMGAEVAFEEGYIKARRPQGQLHGAHLHPDMVTVTGTENLLMAAVLAKGETVIEPAAREPEVGNLAELLCAMGARIKGIGSSRLVVEGVERLHGSSGVAVIPDRIEAGTFLCAVTATGGDVRIHPGDYSHTPVGEEHWSCLFGVVGEKLKEAGATFRIEGRECHISRAPGKALNAVSFRTDIYPAFPTDMQAQLMAVNCVATGSAVMVETIFENRFMHIDELRRLGAEIAVHGNTATSTGVERLKGAPVMATDLRASASLVIAGLAAAGETVIERVYHLDRGYSRMEEKLRGLGARIERRTV